MKVISLCSVAALAAGLSTNNPRVAEWKTVIRDPWQNKNQCSDTTVFPAKKLTNSYCQSLGKGNPSSENKGKICCRAHAEQKLKADKNSDQSATGNQDQFCVQYNANAKSCRVYNQGRREPANHNSIDAMQLTVVPKTCHSDYKLNNAGTNCVSIYESIAPTDFTKDTSTDNSLAGNDMSVQHCAQGYKAVTTRKHFVHDTYHVGEVPGTHDDTSDWREVKTCIKCPEGQSSAGGSSPTCHDIVNTWKPCTHMACRETDSVRHCRLHDSTNPLQSFVTNEGFSTYDCHDIAEEQIVKSPFGEINRISVFHHGHEQSGTMHRCYLEGPVNTVQRESYGTFSGRHCKCMCSHDAYDTPSQCRLTGGHLVDQGWTGNDTGNNYCNSCACAADSHLMCTKKMCAEIPVQDQVWYQDTARHSWNNDVHHEDAHYTQVETADGKK